MFSPPGGEAMKSPSEKATKPAAAPSEAQSDWCGVAAGRGVAIARIAVPPIATHAITTVNAHQRRMPTGYAFRRAMTSYERLSSVSVSLAIANPHACAGLVLGGSE